MELRAMARARERAVGLALLLPGLLLSSLFGSFMAYAAVRGAEAHDPAIVLPLISLIATGVGISWMLSPLLAGVALSESHDVSRLLHFPLPLLTLVAASLVGNLLQPMVLAALPVLASLSLALSRSPAAFPFTLAGSLLSLLFLLAAAQVSGLLLHGLSRRRRFQDVAVFLVIGLGFLMSMAPIVLFSGGARFLGRVARGLVGSDLIAFSPFAWGLRAAVHAGRGEALAFLAWAGAQVAAIAGAAAASAALIERIYRGELELAGGGREEAGRAVMRLPGRIGTLLEKDLRVAWRDPATKATLFLSCATPLFWLFVFTRTSGELSPLSLAMLSMLVGASAFGNAFGLEGRGIALLFGFPVERWRILVAKNLSGFTLRLPGLVTLLVMASFLAPRVLLPAAAIGALSTFLVAAGGDNYVSILFPMVAARPGGNPYGGASAGSRGLGAAALGGLFFLATLVGAAPLVFLAWLPMLFELPVLWVVSLPLALAGAGAVYAMLVAGAARVLERRETDLLQRVLGEV
jgi:ABC-2 type transport system permease protein